jgi:hypothetical protein
VVLDSIPAGHALVSQDSHEIAPINPWEAVLEGPETIISIPSYDGFMPLGSFSTSQIVPGLYPVNPVSLCVAQSGPGKILTSLLLRLLRAYPFMLLKKDTFPPFVNPLLYSLSETKRAPSQQVCLVQAKR